MAKPTITFPNLWAENASYIGGPIPGSSTKVEPPLSNLQDGQVVNEPGRAQWYNWTLNRHDQIGSWVIAGTFNPDKSAHIVETDDNGILRAREIRATGTDPADIDNTYALWAQNPGASGTVVRVDTTLPNAVLVSLNPDTDSSVGVDATVIGTSAVGIQVDATGEGSAGVAITGGNETTDAEIFRVTRTAAPQGGGLPTAEIQGGVSVAAKIQNNPAGIFSSLPALWVIGQNSIPSSPPVLVSCASSGDTACIELQPGANGPHLKFQVSTAPAIAATTGDGNFIWQSVNGIKRLVVGTGSAGLERMVHATRSGYPAASTAAPGSAGSGVPALGAMPGDSGVGTGIDFGSTFEVILGREETRGLSLRVGKPVVLRASASFSYVAGNTPLANNSEFELTIQEGFGGGASPLISEDFWTPNDSSFKTSVSLEFTFNPTSDGDYYFSAQIANTFNGNGSTGSQFEFHIHSLSLTATELANFVPS